MIGKIWFYIAIIIIASIGTASAEIVNIDTKNLDEKGTVDITIKNEGSYKATFAIIISDSIGTYYDNNPYGYQNMFSLDAGETITLTKKVGSSPSQSNTVKIKVYDWNKPSNFDEKEFTAFTIAMTKPKVCKPGNTDVRGSNVYKCKDDGSDWELTISCNNGILDYAGLDKEGNPNYYCKQTNVPKSTPGFDVILSVIPIVAVLSILRILKRT